MVLAVLAARSTSSCTSKARLAGVGGATNQAKQT
jgi:hypothetical protein